jgi:hypothetical protein
MLRGDPPFVAPVGSGAVDDSEAGLSGGEIGTDCALATAVEPRADDALFCGGVSFVALGAIPVSSFTVLGTPPSLVVMLVTPPSLDVIMGPPASGQSQTMRMSERTTPPAPSFPNRMNQVAVSILVFEKVPWLFAQLLQPLMVE